VSSSYEVLEFDPGERTAGMEVFEKRFESNEELARFVSRALNTQLRPVLTLLRQA
jgi:hypothetical protein